MFFNSNKEAEAEEAMVNETVIAENSNFMGNVKLEGAIRINGTVEGEIKVDGDVIVGEAGVIKGNVFATNIMISGEVIGNISVDEQLRLTATGLLKGDILSVSGLIVDQGGRFNGNCKMVE